MKHPSLQDYVPKTATVEHFGHTIAFEVPVAEIITVANDLHGQHQLAFKYMVATDEQDERGCYIIWYVFGAPNDHAFVVPYITLKNTLEFPSLTPTLHQASESERRIRTFFGLTPVGHPDDRPTLLHENWPTTVFPLRKDVSWQTKPKQAHGTYQFQEVSGEGIYEIPVGPIHAGIIEPGHFRFSVAGERIMLLEPRLGFVHKGSEKLFETLPLHDKLRLSEKISGDSSFSHSLAFCQALEQLSDTTVPNRARYLRLVYAELERLANHFGDIGAIMMDTGFSFGGSHGARLRELIMQLYEQLTGSRFLRGVTTIGGVTKDIDEAMQLLLAKRLKEIEADFTEVIEVAENSMSVLNRLKGTGTLPPENARDCGVMGVVGRAIGISADARVDYPYAAYDEITLREIVTEQDGDVLARFRVRIKEAYASFGLIQQAVRKIPTGAITAASHAPVFKKNAVAISIVEGWRGEIVYFVTTDQTGTISRVAPRDPSVVNWTAISHAGFDNVVPDFPLINKSFNMSYTGNDL